MSLGTKMFHSMIWSAIGRLSVQAIQFILGIILARILTPEEYGLLGIIIVFVAISHVFIDSGFTKALVQRQNRTEVDISTVFLFNIVISIVCYLIIWLASPFIADFYEIPSLSLLLRVLALELLLGALFAVPGTLLTIELDFKSLTKVNFVATLISGLVAIYLAYNDYGVWALVFQGLIRSLIMGVMMWIKLKWIPIWVFSVNSFKTLFAFGSKLLISSLLSSIVNNFYNLFIAKIISTKDLGYYSRGSQFPSIFSDIIGSVLDSVLLPVLAKVQDQRELLVTYTKNIIISTALISVPIFFGLAILAEPLVKVLLTDKWLPAVPVLQIICFARLITNISGINVNLLYVIGRTDLALRQQYVKLGIRLVLIIAALKFGIIFIALAELISTAVHFFINTYYPGKIMNYGAFRQIKDMRLILLAGFIMTIGIYIVLNIIENDLLKLIIIPITGAIIYISTIYLFRIPEAHQLVSKLKHFAKP